MKKKPSPINTVTVRVPDYKPALIVTMVCLGAATVAVIFLMIAIVTRSPRIGPAENVSLEMVHVVIDGHEFAAYGSTSFKHSSYCDKCRRVKQP